MKGINCKFLQLNIKKIAMRERTIRHLVRTRHIFLFLFFQLFVLLLAAQVRISGKVSSTDNKGIADISVLVRTTSFGTTTDAEGNYSFTANLKPGIYQVDFSGVGFKASTVQLTVQA